MSLMGRVNYVLSIEPQNEEMRGYKTLVAAWLKEAAQPKKTPEEQP